MGGAIGGGVGGVRKVEGRDWSMMSFRVERRVLAMSIEAVTKFESPDCEHSHNDSMMLWW